MTTSVSNMMTTQYSRGPLDGSLYTTVTQQQRSMETVQRAGKTTSSSSDHVFNRAISNGETDDRDGNGLYMQTKKTTAELEAQHYELDAVLRDLLSQEVKPMTSSIKSQQGALLSAETVDTETVTTHRTSEVVPVYQHQQQTVTVTKTERPSTAVARVEYNDVASPSSSDLISSASASGRTRRLSAGNDSASQYRTAATSRDNGDSEEVVDGLTSSDRYRNYMSDSEDQLAWLQEQRTRLQQSARKSSTWRDKSVHEKQLVTELRSAQNALATLRSRAQSESDDLGRQPAATAAASRRTPVDGRYTTEYNGTDEGGRYSRRTSESSFRRDRFDVQPGHYVSGLERPPFTTQQTVYTFSVGPHRTTSLERGLSTSNYSTMNRSVSPRVPERKESLVETRLVKNQSVDELDRSLNTLLLQATEIESKPVEIIEEEVISLVPIGPGVQNIEPASTSPRFTNVTDGLFVTTSRMANSVSVPASLSISNGGISPPPSSASVATAAGSQSTLTYQRNQSQPFGYATLTNNLPTSTQTLHQSATITVDQQPALQQLIAQQEFQRQQLLQQQQFELQQELQRQEELRRQEELFRQEEFRRQQELQRQEELRRQQELFRQEEFRRQQELQRQEEIRRQQQELQMQQQLEFERQLQQQQLFQRQQQQQQPVMIREEQIIRRGVSSSLSPLPNNQMAFINNNNGQTLSSSSSVSYQTNRRLADTGHSLSVDGGLIHNSVSTAGAAAAGGQASPSVFFNGTLRTTSVSSVDGGDLSSPTPRFVHDTSKIWHRPDISRDEAISMLKDRPAGSFVIRNSSTFQGAFGLAVKVSQLPANVQSKGGDPKSELVRHFLIETTSKGVRLKGCNNEPTFGSLAALVYQHSITPLALPCKLLLPELTDFTETDFFSSSTSQQLVAQETACNVVYVNSTDVESLTGPVAISKAIERTFATGRSPPKTTVVNFKVSSHGITLTDSQRKLFFRRHYPLSSVTYCGLDRQDQRMTFNISETETVTGRLFGFVARKQNSTTENACHLFAEMDNNSSNNQTTASNVVSFVERILSDHGHLMM